MAESVNSSSTIIHTIIIVTTHPKELAGFYTNGLDLGEMETYGNEHVGFTLPNIYLGFDRLEQPLKEQPGAISLWFEVDDLEKTFQRFVDMDANIKYGPTQKPWGAVLAAVFDPDGNVIGLAQRGTT